MTFLGIYYCFGTIRHPGSNNLEKKYFSSFVKMTTIWDHCAAASSTSPPATPPPLPAPPWSLSTSASKSSRRSYAPPSPGTQFNSTKNSTNKILEALFLVIYWAIFEAGSIAIETVYTGILFSLTLGQFFGEIFYVY